MVQYFKKGQDYSPPQPFKLTIHKHLTIQHYVTEAGQSATRYTDIVYEDSSHTGYHTMSTGTKLMMFWRNLQPPVPADKVSYLRHLDLCQHQYKTPTFTIVVSFVQSSQNILNII